jgi:hypothetical protein
VNTTDFLTIVGPSPARNITLPPMMCFIVTFTPSSAPAGKGFKLDYKYVPASDPVTPTPDPNVNPNANDASEGGSKVELTDAKQPVCLY